MTLLNKIQMEKNHI